MTMLRSVCATHNIARSRRNELSREVLEILRVLVLISPRRPDDCVSNNRLLHIVVFKANMNGSTGGIVRKSRCSQIAKHI